MTPSMLGSYTLLAAIVASVLLSVAAFRPAEPCTPRIDWLAESLLVGISDRDLTTISELALHCGEDKAVVALALRRLGDRGLIETRAGTLTITAAGLRALSAGDPAPEPCTCDLCVEEGQ